MPLPYPTKVVLPFDIATAQDMNERHANDVALADGTGLDDGAVTPDKRSGGFYVSDHTFTPGTGIKTITGVPFKPKGIIVHLSPISPLTTNAWSQGYAYESGGGSTIQTGTAGMSSASGHRTVSNVAPFLATNTSATAYSGLVTSWNNDGITVDITLDASAFRRHKIVFWA